MIRFRNLTLGYDRHPAVHHLSGEIRSGALLAVVGPNGAGKSTLLKGLMGETLPLQGGFELGMPADEIAYLPQINDIDRSFPVSVFDMVAMGLWKRVGGFGGLRRQDIERVHDTLSKVGLAGFEQRQIGKLSGGQLQRARFARMMLQDCRLLLLDEPFNAIDSRTTDDLLTLIAGWHGEGRTVLAVLHDLERVGRHFPECLLIARELIAFGPTAEVLTSANLARARALAEQFEEDAPVCHRHPDEAPA